MNATFPFSICNQKIIPLASAAGLPNSRTTNFTAMRICSPRPIPPAIKNPIYHTKLPKTQFPKARIIRCSPLNQALTLTRLKKALPNTLANPIVVILTALKMGSASRMAYRVAPIRTQVKEAQAEFRAEHPAVSSQTSSWAREPVRIKCRAAMSRKWKDSQEVRASARESPLSTAFKPSRAALQARTNRHRNN